jgi:hypothetical protein
MYAFLFLQMQLGWSVRGGREKDFFLRLFFCNLLAKAKVASLQRFVVLDVQCNGQEGTKTLVRKEDFVVVEVT